MVFIAKFSNDNPFSVLFFLIEQLIMSHPTPHPTPLWLAPCRGRGACALCVSLIIQAKSAGTFMFLVGPLRSDRL